MRQKVIDEFSSAARWTPFASGQAAAKVVAEDHGSRPALRLDFDFHGGGGFVGVRREINLRLPQAFSFLLRVRGAAPKNKLEFKLVDPTNRNVWRWQQEHFDFGPEGQELCLRSRQFEFAWGPAGGGSPQRLGAIELVISAGPGGQGTVWLEDLRFEDSTSRKVPEVSASSCAKGQNPAAILRKSAKGGWRSTPSDKRPVLQIDFHQPQEYGGLIVEWEPKPERRVFDVQASDDGTRWRKIRERVRAEGPRSFVSLPGGESRFLRLAFQSPAAIRRIEIQPFSFSRSRDEFFHAIAERSPRGWYPRYLLREQSYWTCAGVPDGVACALINEEGLVEPDKGTFSLEPFLDVRGKLLTWADAKRSVRLEPGGLPIPTTEWALRDLKLETTAFGTGHGEESTLFVRYRITNRLKRVLKSRLYVALRPHQVSPPWQKWQCIGGISEIREIVWKQHAVWVNGEKVVVPLSRPAKFGAATFDHGAIPDHLAERKLPARTRVRDESGLASGALRFDLKIAPGADEEIFMAVPFGPAMRQDAKSVRQLAQLDGAEQFAHAVRIWNERLEAVHFRFPAGILRQAEQTFRTAAGQILINRDGPAIQPGPRRYTRSWIRDGAIMGAALHRVGDGNALADFVRWYAPYQKEDGFVPCCVDRNGPDWLVEHDSHGQLIFAVMESFRFTGDRNFLAEMWPHVRRAADIIEKLRAERLSSEYLSPEKIACRGLLPESASHEGYLTQPVHSYWDDFWAVRGLKDAAAAAAELGHGEEAGHFAALAEDLRQSIRASLREVISQRHLNYVPGSVEWADFDPTATSNAVSLLQCAADLPPEQLHAMFDHYVEVSRKRRRNEFDWNNYSAYEIRIIGALVRLGKRAEAIELLELFLSERRPRRWNQWPEISWRNPRSPGHLGDVPHTWIGAEYMLAFASLFAYEREQDGALVIAAGIDEKWLAGKSGLSIQGLPTWYGPLDLTIAHEEEQTLKFSLGGDLRPPPGGFAVCPPGVRPICSVAVNGRPIQEFSDRQAIIAEFPAEAVLRFAPSSTEHESRIT